ncbi:MAG: YceD family protein [Rhodosalinus sp.]
MAPDRHTAPGTRLRLGALPTSAPTAFEIVPAAAARAEIADRLGLTKLSKLRFAGTLQPEGRGDWQLAAELGATVVQPCSVTLAPVTTRIDAGVERRFLADLPEPEATSETEMPEDETVEALPDILDLSRVMEEALSLELPEYPRAPEAAFEGRTATPPGAAPITDAETRPFAGLAALRDKLSDKE